MSTVIRTSSRRRIERTSAWDSVRDTMSRCGTSTDRATKQELMQARAQRVLGSFAARNVDASSGGCFGLQSLGGIVRDERIDRWLQHAFHHHVQLMIG